jgi:hypothetical protein
MSEESKTGTTGAPAEIPDPRGPVRINLRQFASSLTAAQLADLSREECNKPNQTAIQCIAAVANRLSDEQRARLFEAGDGQKVRAALECVEEKLFTCRGDTECADEMKKCEGDSGLTFEDFFFYEALEEQLRAPVSQSPNLDTTVKIRLSEPFTYAKKAGTPKTESTLFVFFDKSSWLAIFGIPDPETLVPPPVAGLICRIFKTYGQVISEDNQRGRASLIYLDRMSTSVLVDPAFSSLREYLQGRNVPTSAYSLTTLDELAKLQAFFMFGNSVLMTKLMAKPWIDRLKLIQSDFTGDLRSFQYLVLEGFYVYTERREYEMCRFFAYLFHKLKKADEDLIQTFWAQDSELITKYRLFSTAAQAFNTGSGDIRYLKLFWSLRLAGWTNWKECFEQCMQLSFVLRDLVRMSRKYTLSNPLQSEFVEPKKNVPGTNQAYLEQAKQPLLDDFLRQIQKQFLYPPSEEAEA